ncbi:unnamed protein product [Rotaria sp. Silwood2]|nr:unnamed protein product [Rotaria sp. Silwood2]
MNTFLSTSASPTIAIDFAKQYKQTNDLKQIIYQFNINTLLQNTAPYADISSFSAYQSEKELLIAAGSIFKIEEVHYDEDKEVWFAELSLCQKDDFELKIIMDRVKEDIGDGLIGLGYLLARQRKLDKGRQYFQQLINESSGNVLKIREVLMKIPIVAVVRAIADMVNQYFYFDAAQCYQGLGSIAFYEESYDDALAYYQQALKLIEKNNSDDKNSIASINRCIAEVYLWMNELDLAYDHANEAKSLLSDNTLEMARVYSIIGHIYRQRKEPYFAHDYYEKVLDIRISLLPENHSDIGIAYNNIGAFYSDIGEYELALEHFLNSLSIKEKTLPRDHADVQETESNIRVLQQILDADDEQVSDGDQ